MAAKKCRATATSVDRIWIFICVISRQLPRREITVFGGLRVRLLCSPPHFCLKPAQPTGTAKLHTMTAILSTAWSSTNGSMMLHHVQPEQTAPRMLGMHRNTQSNAVVYIVVVLLLYATALVVIMVRYLKRERDESRLSYLYHEFVRLDLFRRRKKTPDDPQETAESSGTPHVIVTIATNTDIDATDADAITHV
ncbi:uncharacterized protein [Periplaneta americana]|uniref:uncharacterized protein n=1 Tax=Periplaneta americana TaxID=6978 RepID=UPI0037E832C1